MPAADDERHGWQSVCMRIYSGQQDAKDGRWSGGGGGGGGGDSGLVITLTDLLSSFPVSFTFPSQPPPPLLPSFYRSVFLPGLSFSLNLGGDRAYMGVFKSQSIILFIICESVGFLFYLFEWVGFPGIALLG